MNKDEVAFQIEIALMYYKEGMEDWFNLGVMSDENAISYCAGYRDAKKMYPDHAGSVDFISRES